MIKNFLNIIFFIYSISCASQIILPIDFENNQITTDDFVNFDGGTGSVIGNPYNNVQNSSLTVGQIIRDGGQIWAGSYLVLADYLDFSSNTHISMNVYSPISWLTVKFKLESDSGAQTERDTSTTLSNDWETLTWSFAGEPSNTYNKLVLMFDFGVISTALLTIPSESWEPKDCPLCKQGVPVTERGRTGKKMETA